MSGFLNATSFVFTRCAPELLKQHAKSFGNLAWYGLAQGLINSRDRAIKLIGIGLLAGGAVALSSAPRRTKLLCVSLLTAGAAVSAAGLLYPALSQFSTFANGWDEQYMISLAEIASNSPNLPKNCQRSL